jgi:hypothetical protein
LNEAISEVYRYLDLNDYVPSTINQNSPDTLGWILEAQTTATGESLHYLALQLLVRKKIGIWTNDMQSAANIIADRQTQNLFFMWLSQGKTHGLCNRVLGLAPVTKPARHLNWTWEHSDRERSWRESMGWDFIYLGEACLK